MPVPQQGKRSFGADDHPICPECGGPDEPHPPRPPSRAWGRFRESDLRVPQVPARNHAQRDKAGEPHTK